MKNLLSNLKAWVSLPGAPPRPWIEEIECLLQLPWPADESSHAPDDDGAVPAWARVCAVFFCARAVEGAVKSAVVPLSLRHSTRRETDLDQRIGNLEASGRLDSLGATALQHVRSVGNEVRHRGAYPGMLQTHLCVVALSIALPRLVGSDAAVGAWRNAAARDGLDRDVRVFEQALDDPTLIRVEGLKSAVPLLLARWSAAGDARDSGNHLLLWAIERWIDAGRCDLAGQLLAPWIPLDATEMPARLRAPDDDVHRVGKLSRLAALRWSRTGDPARAVSLLTPLAIEARYLPQDWPAADLARVPQGLRLERYDGAETLGILAGAHKRLWNAARAGDARLAQGSAEDHLRAASRLYAAVHSAQPWNHYVAINHAATAAWSGQADAAVGAARHTLDELRPLRADPRRSAHANLWADLTWAEALLIGGEAALACVEYRRAVERHSEHSQGAVRSAMQQLALHLDVGLVRQAKFEDELRAIVREAGR